MGNEEDVKVRYYFINRMMIFGFGFWKILKLVILYCI